MQDKMLPATNTLPGLLLTVTALAGELPVSLLSRLPGANSYKEFALKRLKRDKLLRTYYSDGLRGLRLTAHAKRLLLAAYPDRFLRCFTGDTATNAPKYTVPHRLRLYRMAEVLVTMLNTDVLALPWEKPPLFYPSPPPTDINISHPAYYSSREIKEIGPQAAKIRGSRATGVLLTDGGIFIVYNTASSPMKWEYRAELRLKALLQIEVCQHRLPQQFAGAELSAIVFGDGMAPMEAFMDVGENRMHNYFILDGSIEHFYYLTNDHRGEAILQLLYNRGLKASLDQILSEDLSANKPNWLAENDAIDDTGNPVLFAYTCDMPRIRRFDTALMLHDLSGTIFCFDFQSDALRRICSPRIAIQSIDFDAFERSICHTEESS